MTAGEDFKHHTAKDLTGRGFQTTQINLPSAAVENTLVFLLNIEICRKPKIHLAVESVVFLKSYTLPEGQASCECVNADIL